MRIVGHGVDVVDVARVERLLATAREDFLASWFTAAELDDAPNDATSPTFFAGRVAAKESIVKALGTGLIGEMSWPEIEIRRESSGAPYVVLHGATLKAAQSRHISAWLLSISHTFTVAIASAIAIGDT